MRERDFLSCESKKAWENESMLYQISGPYAGVVRKLLDLPSSENITVSTMAVVEIHELHGMLSQIAEARGEELSAADLVHEAVRLLWVQEIDENQRRMLMTLVTDAAEALVFGAQ